MNDPKPTARLDRQAQLALGDTLRHSYDGLLETVPPHFVRLLRLLRDRESAGAGGIRAERVASPARDAVTALFSGHAFDPQSIATLESAFDDALAMTKKIDYAVNAEELAQHILDLAAQGERNPARLAARALTATVLHKPIGRDRR
jgi:hypothetical protein